MKQFDRRKLLISSVFLMGLMLVSDVKIVKADTITDKQSNSIVKVENSMIPDKNLILPVASRDNQTLRQVAEANNVSLDVIEKLNDNIDPDTIIKNGQQLYLPQNQNVSLFLVSLFTAHSGISNSQYKKYYGNLSASERSAKLWIAYRESSYNYHARNGKYYGRFQLDVSYLHGDYSVANQERTADKYVKNRYGSWVAAKNFWLSHGWY